MFAEVLADVAFRLRAAATGRRAGHAAASCRGCELLTGYRGERPVDLDAVADMIVNVGDLLCVHPEIAEIDLNPVAASADGCVALDARIIVNDERAGAGTAP